MDRICDPERVLGLFNSGAWQPGREVGFQDQPLEITLAPAMPCTSPGIPCTALPA